MEKNMEKVREVIADKLWDAITVIYIDVQDSLGIRDWDVWWDVAFVAEEEARERLIDAMTMAIGHLLEDLEEEKEEEA